MGYFHPTAACDGLFDPAGVAAVVARMDEQLAQGDLHDGAALAVYRHGRLAFEAGGGLARKNPASTAVVTAETPFVLLSATKAWAAVCAHQLAEEGRLDYDATVASYWPEFARHGKDAVTVRQALSHRGGYPQPARELDAEKVVEESELRWEPGSRNAYHFSNFGDTVAGLVRRIDGRTIQQYVNDEVFGRIVMEGAWLGPAPDESFPDATAWIYEKEAGSPGGQFPNPVRGIDPWYDEYQFMFNRPDAQRAGRPSGFGIATAEAHGRFYGALANGGVVEGMAPGASPLLRPETVATMSARTNQPDDLDGYMQLQISWGMGVHLGGTNTGGKSLGLETGGEHCFGHGGGACTVGWADPELGIGCGHLTNGNLKWGLKPFHRTGEIADLIRSAAR